MYDTPGSGGGISGPFSRYPARGVDGLNSRWSAAAADDFGVPPTVAVATVGSCSEQTTPESRSTT